MQSEKVISSNLEEKLRNALRRLSERERTLFSLYLTGYAYEEIAEKLGESAYRINYEMNAARAKIRHSLKNSLEDTGEKDKISEQEADLLLEINTIFPAEKRQKYNELYAKSKNESLTQKENKELLKLSDEFEVLNAKRLEYLGELAKLRGQSLRDVIKDLGIKS